MVSIDKVNTSDSYRFVLSPNCSISWHELVLLYIFTCVVALAIGIFFTIQGMWLVLPFSGLEMLALGACLYLTSRKVYRKEVITLDQRRIRIEKGVQQVSQSWEFETPWIRLIDEQTGARDRQRKLAIGSHGNYVEVGAFLDNSEKERLAFQLKDCIIRV
ncbi:MAG: DUF2244 domain-containing protein [Gammaproteobacteria bacterium]|nr:DUF2244 domain-containing protein [Gammaproteobacteria bacterium]MDH3534267.1 DUF2244 domain-containing protein [Gammaproteobacteria bacterium]